MTRLILVTHAATAATRRAAFAVGSEAPEEAALVLAARRRAELPALGEALTSPAVAARRTAEALGLTPTCEPALRDLDAGGWAGKALSETAPDDLAAWLTDPAYAGHGGESVAALIARVEALLAARLGSDGAVVAVTHGAVLRAALVATLGAPASAFWRIDAPPLTILSLSSDGRRWALRGLVPPVRASGG